MPIESEPSIGRENLISNTEPEKNEGPGNEILISELKELIFLAQKSGTNGEFNYDDEAEDEYDETSKELGRLYLEAWGSVLEKLDNLRKKELSPKEKIIISHIILGIMNTVPENSYYRLVESYSDIISDGAVLLKQEDVEKLDKFDPKGKNREELIEMEILAKRKERILNTLELPSQWRTLDYEPFDPYLEMRKIRHFKTGLPNEERSSIQKTRMAEYQKKQDEQKRGIKNLLKDLKEATWSDPDLAYEEMESMLYGRAAKARLTPHQISLFEKGLTDYMIKHETVKTYRRIYQDDDELFNSCFGREPKGEIKVRQGPITLYFRCFELDDYSLIYNQDLVQRKEVTKEMRQKADRSGGVFISRCRIARLKNCIIAENSHHLPPGVADYISEEIYAHEEQHAIHRLLEGTGTRDGFGKKEIISEEEEILESQLKKNRNKFLEDAKNEILAYIKTGKESLKNIASILSKKEEQGGLYNYYRDWEKESAEAYKKVFTKLGLESNKIEEIFEKIFVKEYQSYITKALKAVDMLERRGSSWQDIIHQLGHEPLTEWLNCAGRAIALDEIRSGKPIKRWRDVIVEKNKMEEWEGRGELFLRQNRKKIKKDKYPKKSKFPNKGKDFLKKANIE
ncbi:MAG: hypothetical protein WCW77_04250 [Patescibacteria group bacterium]|jgi:hypothetical protein